MRPFISLLLFCAIAPFHGTAAAPSWQEYRATVLVRDFAALGVPRETGALAAESLAAAIEKSGLANAVRPIYAPSTQWYQSLDYVRIDDVLQDDEGIWRGGTIDVYGIPHSSVRYREIFSPNSDFVVEGTVSRIGELFWTRAALYKRVSRLKLASAAAFAQGDKGLIEASELLAGQLQEGYMSDVLAERAEEIRRKAATGILPRSVAIKKLGQMNSRWPNALEPVAVRLLLATESDEPNPGLIVSWANEVSTRLPHAGAEGQRFLLRLGLDPYELLAKEYEAAGKLKEAAAAHREAVRNFQGSRLSHWKELARLEEALGQDGKAIEACRAALKLKPSDPDVNLRLGLLLEKLGRNTEAAKHLRAFLAASPDSPRAKEVRAKLKKPTAPSPTEATR